MSGLIVVLGIVLIILALWIEANPDNDFVVNNGLLSISGIIFWIGALIFIIPLVLIFVVFGGIGLALLSDR